MMRYDNPLKIGLSEECIEMMKHLTERICKLEKSNSEEARDYYAKELEDLKKEFSKFKMGVLADMFSYKNKMEKNIEELVEELKSYINDIEISFERHFNELKYRNEEPRDYPAGNIEENERWHEVAIEIPSEDMNIIMKNAYYHVPPWTGYHDGENFVAYETRLPIWVSHWKYVE